MYLEGAAAIVTGSSSGVGAATARMLAERGVNVVVNYARSAEAAEAVAAECRALGARVLCLQGDVADDTACRAMVEAAVSEFGRLDILVNNAGTTKFVNHADLDGLDKDDFFHIYGVNVVGPYQMARAAEAALRAVGDAAIVNVSSIAGVRGVGSSIAYAASKGALITMTKSLARMMGPEVRVNTVCPGFIEGDWLREGMGDELYVRNRQRIIDRTPLQRVCTPESVAESILGFVAGHSIISGEHVILDGGAFLN